MEIESRLAHFFRLFFTHLRGASILFISRSDRHAALKALLFYLVYDDFIRYFYSTSSILSIRMQRYGVFSPFTILLIYFFILI